MVNINVDFGNMVVIRLSSDLTSVSLVCDYDDFVNVNRTQYVGGGDCFYIRAVDVELSIEFQSNYECIITCNNVILRVQYSAKYTDSDKEKLLHIIEQWREEYSKIKKYF